MNRPNFSPTPYLTIAFLLLTLNVANAQDLTFKDVAPIIHTKCSPCHHADGSAPFPLVTYEDVAQKSKTVDYVLEKQIMPPWHTDPAYHSFYNEIIISASEVELLRKWIGGGKQKGNVKFITYPDFKPKAKDKTGLTIHMDKKYLVKANNSDQFTWFQVPWVFKQSASIKSIQIKTSNPKVEHHSEVFANDFAERPVRVWPTDSINRPLILTSTDSTENGRGSFFNHKQFVAGRFPGTGSWNYPKGITDSIGPGKYLLFYTHFAPHPVDEFDSASLQIQFGSKSDDNRAFVELGVHGFHDLAEIHFSHQTAPAPEQIKTEFKKGSKLPFFIPKDSVVTFHCIKTIAQDYSAFLCLPHAHHICTNMLAYAITPEGDTLPIIKINKWNFEWQFIYQFKKMMVFKKGTKIHFFATYDNTASNPKNPFSPTQDIYTSMNANDEMMDLFLHVVPYRTGDEDKALQYDY